MQKFSNNIYSVFKYNILIQTNNNFINITFTNKTNKIFKLRNQSSIFKFNIKIQKRNVHYNC